MASVAVESAPVQQPLINGNGVNPLKAPSSATSPKVLVIGTPAAAGDGSYQKTVEDVKSHFVGGQGEVELQMADRILEGATALPSSSYTHAIILSSSLPDVTNLASSLLPALAPAAILEVRGLSSADDLDNVQRSLKLSGYTGVAAGQAGEVKATKPSYVSTSTFSLKRSGLSSSSFSTVSSSATHISVPTPEQPRPFSRPSSSASKKAFLWSLNSSTPGTPTIDESTLLTAEDLERPKVAERPDCDVKKTRKACKNCTCGLREVLLEEKDDLPKGLSKAVDSGKFGVDTVGLTADEKERERLKDAVQKVNTGAVSSSCGNCSLGDAFRCASCPYLGLPAFEPGQKIEIPASFMGDDI